MRLGCAEVYIVFALDVTQREMIFFPGCLLKLHLDNINDRQLRRYPSCNRDW